MRPLFEFHQLSVDCIDNHPPNSIEEEMLINLISHTAQIVSLVLII